MTRQTLPLLDRHGLFLRRDFIDAGGTQQALKTLVRTGVIHRVRHGAYTPTDRWQALDKTARHVLTGRAVLRSNRCDAALSHVTAYALHGGPLWDLPLDQVHVTRPDGRPGRREAGVVQHGSIVRPEELWEIDTTRVTSPARTAVDMAAVNDLEHTLVALDWLLHTSKTTKQDVIAAYDHHIFAPGSLHTELAVRLADPAAESVGESRCRFLFWSSSIPMPIAQVEVHDDSGRLLGRVDFAWPDLDVFLEFDGKGKYVDHLRAGQSTVDAVLSEKKREEQICRATGWRCIRLTWSDLSNPSRTAAYLHSVLAGGPIH